MGRKKGDSQADTGQAGGNGSAKPKNKTQAVKAALRDGIKSPKLIAEHVLKEYGIDITTNYVSVIKGKLKKGRKGRKKQSKEEGQDKAASRTTSTRKSGLSPDDLVELVDLAHKAGGYDKLQDFLRALNRIK